MGKCHQCQRIFVFLLCTVINPKYFIFYFSFFLPGQLRPQRRLRRLCFWTVSSLSQSLLRPCLCPTWVANAGVLAMTLIMFKSLVISATLIILFAYTRTTPPPCRHHPMIWRPDSWMPWRGWRVWSEIKGWRESGGKEQAAQRSGGSQGGDAH